jgi:hypothetical protein
VRQYSFTDWQVNNPTAPHPGDKLDSEYDNSNQSISATITWASTSLNTDGTVRDGIIGNNQLVPGLFDSVANDAIAEVQPLVDQAQSYADAAGTSASDAETAATAAGNQNTAAQGAANTATTSAASATQSASTAQLQAMAAQNAASAAANADNHATGEAAAASDYAVLTQAWAEHMPDTIPPNILANMGVTGDHWSSRWWANRAAELFGGMTTLYLGAYSSPPSTTPTGDTIPIGAIYYNTTSQQPFVWTGTAWAPFAAPTKALMLTLIYRAIDGQTVFPLTTNDLNNQSYVISASDPEPVDLYVNGVRVPRNAPVAGSGDWDLNPTTSTITFLTPLLVGSLVQIDVLAPASSIAPSRVQTQALLDFNIDPVTGNPGQIDGVKTTFPMVFASDHATAVTASDAQELMVSLDGVVQQPGTDYTVSATNITFSAPPLLGARAWSVWYGPGLSGTGPGAGYLPITGGTLTGPLTLNADPTQTLQAATKRYVDTFAGAVVSVLSYLPVGQPDGVTDNASNINTALAAAAGKTLVFPATAHNYMVHGLYVPSNSHVIIQGTLQLMAGQTGYILVCEPNGKNIIIEGTGTLDGNKANQTTQASGGIGGDGGTNITVRGLTITNCLDWAFNLTNTTHGLAESLTMTNCGASCEFAINCHDCWFRNCTIAAIADLGIGFYGGGTNCGIVNCVISSAGGDGIFILNDNGQPAPSNNVLIQGNICHNNAGSGIIVASNVSPSGFSHTNVTIADNTSYGNGGLGISANPVLELLISGNVVYSNTYASAWPGASGDIWVGSSSSGVKISGNYLYNCQQGSTLGFGIALDLPNFAQISDNYFADGQTTKTMAGAIGGQTGQHNSISGNHYGTPFIGAADQVTYGYNSVQGLSIDANSGVTTGSLYLQGHIGVSSFTTVGLQQGAWLEWNRASNGATYLINQKGLGTGGFHLAEADGSGNLTDRLTIDGSGNATVAGNLTVPSVTGNHFYLDYPTPLPLVTRLGDRATVAATNNFSLNAAGQNQTWAGTVYNNGYLERDATLSAVSNAAGFALYGAARASDWKNSSGTPQAYGVAAFAVADAANSIGNAVYAEARLQVATGFAYGVEIDIYNQAGPPPATNSFAMGPPGFCYGIVPMVSQPAGLTSYNANSALAIMGGQGKSWLSGILFQSTALAGTNGADGNTGIAIQMARGHLLRWDTGSGSPESAGIVSLATGQAQRLVFSDTGLQINREDTGATMLNVAAGAATASVGVSVGASNTVAASTLAVGNSNQTNGVGTVALGLNNFAINPQSVSIGHGANDGSRIGAFSHSSGWISSGGDSQFCRQTLHAVTTTATPVVATADGNAAGAANVFNLGGYKYSRLTIKVVARSSTTGNGACWAADNVLLGIGGTNASTTLSTATFTLGGVNGTVTWSVAATADTTNGGIRVACTGAAADTVHWSVSIDAVEVQ